MEEVKRIVDALNTTRGVIGCGIVTKDGRPVEMRLPPGTNTETVSIMCATIFGGSMTLNTEMGKPGPEEIRIDSSGGGRTRIYKCGARSLAMVMLGSEPDNDAVEKHIQDLTGVFGAKNR